jgi:5'-phosphate synthase pdxT subunit
VTPPGPGPLVGILALQGDTGGHIDHLTGLGARTRCVRRAHELDGLDAIVIPGGESTTMSRLLDVFQLREPLAARLGAGLPAYGSCAGMIMLAKVILHGRPDQSPLGAIDITVRRNAFGRQRESFECDLQVTGLSGDPFRAAFIRAPQIEGVGEGVQVLARIDGHAVAARTGQVLVSSFHPEILQDSRFHQLFLHMVSSRT